jgi:predicted Zn-dependent protease
MKYTIELVRKNLSTKRKWVEGAIVKLYEFQTAEEQKSEYTSNKNNVGFNAFDAKTLTYYAKWILSGKHLSGEYLEKAFSMVPKYAQQILNCIEAKEKEPVKYVVVKKAHGSIGVYREVMTEPLEFEAAREESRLLNITHMTDSVIDIYPTIYNGKDIGELYS